MSNDQNRQQLLINHLGLSHLNIEAGWFSLVATSPLEVTSEGESHTASNLIYLMLNADEPINYVQWLASDDYQVLIEGGPADYYLFYADGRVEKRRMGRDIANGETLVVHAPAATAKAIVLASGASYLLAASVVTPAWSPTRARIGGDESFVDRYAGRADWATREQIIELIGPNYGHVIGGDTDTFVLTVEESSEILFQGMQLSESQAVQELIRFSERHPGAGVRIMSHPEQSDLASRLTEAARRCGLTVG